MLPVAMAKEEKHLGSLMSTSSLCFPQGAVTGRYVAAATRRERGARA